MVINTVSESNINSLGGKGEGGGGQGGDKNEAKVEIFI